MFDLLGRASEAVVLVEGKITARDDRARRLAEMDVSAPPEWVGQE